MAGNVYTRQKCPVCGSSMKHDERKRGCFCPSHNIPATTFFVKFNGVFKNFTSYSEAIRFLTGLRYKFDEGSFDSGDYRKDQPNSFKNLVETYLTRKEGKKSFSHMQLYMYRASDYFEKMNVRHINGANIDDYAYSLTGLSDKTRSNYLSQLHDFFNWLRQRGVIQDIPIFPKIDYELGRRKITDWETQALVLETLREMSWHVSEKIWLGCDMLSAYTALRPDDLRRVFEDSLDENGFLTIHNPTKRKNKFKVIRLLPEHVDEWRRLQNLYPAVPTMPFFRHKPHGREANLLFGKNMFRKWWDRACKKVGLDGVSLYPGTKHTTATETAKLLGSDKALQASGLTNKAFERYCLVENSGAFETVRAVRQHRKSGKIIPLKTKKVQL